MGTELLVGGMFISPYIWPAREPCGGLFRVQKKRRCGERAGIRGFGRGGLRQCLCQHGDSGQHPNLLSLSCLKKV